MKKIKQLFFPNQNELYIKSKLLVLWFNSALNGHSISKHDN